MSCQAHEPIPSCSFVRPSPYPAIVVFVNPIPLQLFSGYHRSLLPLQINYNVTTTTNHAPWTKKSMLLHPLTLHRTAHTTTILWALHLALKLAPTALRNSNFIFIK